MVLGKGNCKCLNIFERELILKSFSRSMREESNIIDNIRMHKDDIKKDGWNIDELISVHLKILADFQKVKTEVDNTPVCEYQ